MDGLLGSAFHFAKESRIALNTQTSYVLQVSLFARHFNQSPEQLGLPTQLRNWRISSGLRTTGNFCGFLGAGMTSSKVQSLWSETL